VNQQGQVAQRARESEPVNQAERERQGPGAPGQERAQVSVRDTVPRIAIEHQVARDAEPAGW